MKINILLCCVCLLLISTAAMADSLVVGTPSNSLLSTPTGFAPRLTGTTVVLNFDTLTAFTSMASFASNGIVISSPDGLTVLPFSTQSFPMELFDNSSNGTADITILFNRGVPAFGIGIADSDPVSVTFQALNSALLPFGTAFSENLAATESPVNTGNGYYVIQDTLPDIFGIHITQPTGNVNFSGLAIDDVQVAVPEPGSAVLALSAIVLMIMMRKHLARLKRT